MKKPSSPKFPRAGYRIHFDRLRDIRSSASFIRTHKFKCEIPKSAEQELQEKFEKVAKVVDSAEEGSILWFLTQLYGLGFLFVPKEGEKSQLLSELQGTLSNDGDNIKKQLPAELLAEIKDYQALHNFCITAPRQVYEKVKETGVLPTGVLQNLAAVFEPAENITVKNYQDYPIVKKWHDKVVTLILEKKDLKVNDIQQLFGIKISKANTGGTTFVIQEIPLPELKKNAQDGIDIFKAYFKYLSPAAQKTGREIQSLAGVSDNQNALSNFLNKNKTLGEFRKSVETAKHLIAFGNPDFFLRNPDVLDLLAHTVHQLAKKIDSPEESDLIAQDWSQYRAAVGGRLQGWLSNFMNRLTEFTDTLSNTVHQKELEQWGLPKDIIANLLIPEGLNQFAFPQNSSDQLKKELEEHLPDKKYKIAKENLVERFHGIRKCTLALLQKIKSNCRYENIFPETFRGNFNQLESLQFPLLAKLRSVTLGIPDQSNDSRDLGLMIDEYHQFLQPINEFLMKWNNEGIPLKLGEIDATGDQEISSELLETKQKKNQPSDSESEKMETSQPVLGYFRKDFIPKDLPRYPRFLYHGQKAAKREIEIAKMAGQYGQNSDSNSFDIKAKLIAASQIAKDTAAAAERFCRSTEQSKDQHWEAQNWLTTRKLKNDQLTTVWHLGYFHKSLEALREIAQRAKNPRPIIDFLQSFAIESKNSPEWREYLGLLESQHYQFVTEKENHDNRFEPNWKIDSNSRFYLSGREYRNDWKILATKICSHEQFLKRFQEHFKLTPGSSMVRFLEIEHGATDNSTTQAELLKFWWARRMAPIQEELTLSEDFSTNSIFTDNILARLLFEKDHQKAKVSRADASRFLQSGLAADLRAKIGLLSRKEFVIRNVLQSGDGDTYQTILQYVPLPWGGGQESLQEENLIKDKFDDLKLKMSEVRGKDPIKYGRLKRQLRRLRLSQRSPLQKLKKRLYHLQRDLDNFQNQGVDPSILSTLKQRKTTLEEKLTTLEKGQTFGFSTTAKDKLKVLFAGQEIPSTNEEIVKAVWGLKSDHDFREYISILGEIPHRWKIVLRTAQEVPSLQSLEIKTGYFFGKTNGKNIFNLKPKGADHLYSFPLATSVVQKQFLERFLWDNRQPEFSESILAHSLILERTCKINWLQNQIEFTNADFQLYCAIPFQFAKTGEKVEDKIYRQSIHDQGENLLGIDLGEYGFGWAVFNPKTRTFEASGFQEVPLLKTMRDAATSWKDTQSRGIFSRPTTHLADLREQAAGQARNQIHRLALQYHARPIYEDSVDGFESGGSRIEKLYKTLKTADVIGGNSNEADRSVRKHFWAVDFAQMGGVIGSAKTSQTCRTCGRCATSEIEQEILHAQDEFHKSKLKEKLQLVKKAQRTKNPEKEGRGQDALFICQICGNQTDADEQAAQNIALKYYFKTKIATPEDLKNKDFQTDQNQFSSLKFFLKKSAEYGQN